MFESKGQRPLTRGQFVRRLALSLALAVAVLAIGLSIGMLGYHFIAGFAWVDALLEASMILTGMGPVGALTTTGAKLFSSCYAIFSGVLFLSVMGITLAPLLHRVLHKFHVAEEDLDEKS